MRQKVKSKSLDILCPVLWGWGVTQSHEYRCQRGGATGPALCPAARAEFNAAEPSGGGTLITGAFVSLVPCSRKAAVPFGGDEEREVEPDEGVEETFVSKKLHPERSKTQVCRTLRLKSLDPRHIPPFGLL